MIRYHFSSNSHFCTNKKIGVQESDRGNEAIALEEVVKREAVFTFTRRKGSTSYNGARVKHAYKRNSGGVKVHVHERHEDEYLGNSENIKAK